MQKKKRSSSRSEADNMEVFVRGPAGGVKLLCFPEASVVKELQQRFTYLQGVPSVDFYIKTNGRLSDPEDALQHGAVYHLEPRLHGGKGGFGSMLRALGAQIEKTTNREACRDLSGRRLRDVNHEKEMAEWLKKQTEREAEKEQRRLERLQRKLAEPKHQFTDTDYQQQCHDLSERLEDSVLKGLQASSDSGAKAEGGNAKRPNSGQRDESAKKKQKTACLMGDCELDAMTSSEEEEEEPSTSTCTATVSAVMQKREGDGPRQEEEKQKQEEEGPRQEEEKQKQEEERPRQEEEKQKQEEERPRQEEEKQKQEEEGPRQEEEKQKQEEERPRQEEEKQKQEEEGPRQEEEKQKQEEEGPRQEEEKQTQEEEQRGSEETQSSSACATSSSSSAQIQSVASPPAEAPGVQQQEAVRASVDLDRVASAQELEGLGLDVLKEELMSRGLKCGGTLSQRAARLFSTRGLKPQQIDPTLHAKAGGQRSKVKPQNMTQL
ncbi:splicing regulator SDE2 isoform X2 [Genypterus blacodes]|uniref:splicing regulator SDE2 isoform X2 n=1 Tax=Genypterus blacodes TaxID=154954 RepID=UPI003F759CFA